MEVMPHKGKGSAECIGHEKHMSGVREQKGGPPYGGGVGSEMLIVSAQNANCALRPINHAPEGARNFGNCRCDSLLPQSIPDGKSVEIIQIFRLRRDHFIVCAKRQRYSHSFTPPPCFKSLRNKEE